MIAKHLADLPEESRPLVIVERSRTSKRWETIHEYPVHFNDELDKLRREMVVEVLRAFGIVNADDLVVVAPAYPTGLNAREAGAAYFNALGNWNQGNRSGAR